MNKVTLLFFLFCCSTLFAQNEETKDSLSQKGFVFTTVKANKITSIKNQASSGTCWAFSGIAFLESELLRMGKPEYDLSEMFIVHNNYQEKAVKYVRMHGKTNFAEGGAFADVFEVVKNAGIVPDTIMRGLNYGEEKHKHGELDAVARAYVDAIIENPNKRLSTAWFEGFKGVLDAYLGKLPEQFTYNGVSYTPKTFAASLGLNMDDYISLTSFTHHPFYTRFAIEIEDNWRWKESYNITLDELMRTIDNAIENGYTIAWAADVSEKGFTRQGIGVVPDIDPTRMPAGTDEEKWFGLSQKEKDDLIYKIEGPVKEKVITQELRQQGFDNYETTDDHGMLIFGIAKDQDGNKYYMVKNSWGTDNKYKGIWYVSEAYVRCKTIDIAVHKNAIPSDIKAKIGL